MRFPDLFLSFLLIILLSGSASLSLQAQHFVVPNTKTGSDATILIATSASPSINGEPLSDGDEIAVFSPGGLLTGMAVWNESSVSVTVWGDNIMTEPVDGLKEGEVMSFSIWDKSENKEYSNVEVSYSSSKPFFNATGKYVSNGIYSIASLNATSSSSPSFAKDDQATTDEDVAVTIDVLANDSAPDGKQLDASTLSIVDKPDHGVTRIDSTPGKIIYEPEANYNGTDEFTYKISDAGGTLSATARVTVHIKAVNDLPKLSKPVADQSLDLKDRKVFTINLEAAGIFVDVDDEELAYTAQSSDNAIATAEISGTVLTITALAKGSVTVTLNAQDDSGSSAEHQFKVKISPDAIAKGKVSGKLVFGNSSQPVKNVQIALKSQESVVDIDTTSVDGTFSFETEDGNYQLEILGSGPVKGVTTLDAAIVRTSLSAGKKPLSNLQQRASDVNADGEVDMKDVHLINEFAVGKVASFPAGTHFLNQEVIEVSGVSSEELTIGMFAVGDVDQSGAQQKDKPDQPTQQSQAINASAGSAFSVPVFVENEADLGALMLEISYPGNVAELTGFNSPLQGVIENVTDNKVRLAWVGDESGVHLDAGSTLLVLEFRALTGIEDLTLGISSELADANATLLTVATTLDPSVTTDTAQQEELPSEFALQGNYPNPFNPTTTIRFDLPQPAELQLQVFDITGRQVAVLPTWSAPAGKNQEIQFEAGSMPSGTYLYRLNATIGGKKVAKTGRMLLLK